MRKTIYIVLFYCLSLFCHGSIDAAAFERTIFSKETEIYSSRHTALKDKVIKILKDCSFEAYTPIERLSILIKFQYIYTAVVYKYVSNAIENHILNQDDLKSSQVILFNSALAQAWGYARNIQINLTENGSIWLENRSIVIDEAVVSLKKSMPQKIYQKAPEPPLSPFSERTMRRSNSNKIFSYIEEALDFISNDDIFLSRLLEISIQHNDETTEINLEKLGLFLSQLYKRDHAELKEQASDKEKRIAVAKFLNIFHYLNPENLSDDPIDFKGSDLSFGSDFLRTDILSSCTSYMTTMWAFYLQEHKKGVIACKKMKGFVCPKHGLDICGCTWTIKVSVKK